MTDRSGVEFLVNNIATGIDFAESDATNERELFSEMKNDRKWTQNSAPREAVQKLSQMHASLSQLCGG
jgi:hypothetical protein